MRAAVLICLVVFAATAHANEIVDRIGAVDEARIRFEYATRPGVAGDGRSLITGTHQFGDWHCDCSEGPARVQVRVRDGEVIDVDVRVGGRWRASNARIVDLGTVAPGDAADALLSVVESASGGDVEDAILGAVIADGFDDYERLVSIARTRRLPQDVRESAVFWLGVAAGERAAAQLTRIVDDENEELALREHAIFALSQRKLDECFEPLERVATTSRHPQLRERAFFWLAQHDDPRVIDFFEDVLMGAN